MGQALRVLHLERLPAGKGRLISHGKTVSLFLHMRRAFGKAAFNGRLSKSSSSLRITKRGGSGAKHSGAGRRRSASRRQARDP
jgi:hypothetical protein